jgi:hypothetical protein
MESSSGETGTTASAALSEVTLNFLTWHYKVSTATGYELDCMGIEYR